MKRRSQNTPQTRYKSNIRRISRNTLRKEDLDNITSDRYKSHWVNEWELSEYEGLCEEYLEMTIQFGFVTIFSAAFPLAALFALLNNWIEIRLDAQKLLMMVRRPISQRASSIGIWFDILEVIVRIAVVSNAFLIAFTSQWIPQLLYWLENSTLNDFVNQSLSIYTFPADYNSKQGNFQNLTTDSMYYKSGKTCKYFDYRDSEGNYTTQYYKVLCAKLLFVLIFEHVVFFIGNLIDFMVPDVPSTLKNHKLRLRYLAKQALSKNQQLIKDKLDLEQKEEQLRKEEREKLIADFERKMQPKQTKSSICQTEITAKNLLAGGKFGIDLIQIDQPDTILEPDLALVPKGIKPLIPAKVVPSVFKATPGNVPTQFNTEHGLQPNSSIVSTKNMLNSKQATPPAHEEARLLHAIPAEHSASQISDSNPNLYTQPGPELSLFSLKQGTDLLGVEVVNETGQKQKSYENMFG